MVARWIEVIFCTMAFRTLFFHLVMFFLSTSTPLNNLSFRDRGILGLLPLRWVVNAFPSKIDAEGVGEIEGKSTTSDHSRFPNDCNHKMPLQRWHAAPGMPSRQHQDMLQNVRGC